MVSVVKSCCMACGFGMVNGVLYLFQALLVLAELIEHSENKIIAYFELRVVNCELPFTSWPNLGERG